jgi:catechol 2,3-dioxygenase-like lactoylglutathione lyase family enzyme
MKVDHFAVAVNSEKEADKFFIELLNLKKVRQFEVNADLMDQFFNVAQKTELIRYENDKIAAEIFITGDNSSSKDYFTHQCLLVEERDKFLEKAQKMGYKCVKVPRKEKNSYYLFIQDSFGNIYEIKEE